MQAYWCRAVRLFPWLSSGREPQITRLHSTPPSRPRPLGWSHVSMTAFLSFLLPLSRSSTAVVPVLISCTRASVTLRCSALHCVALRCPNPGRRHGSFLCVPAKCATPARLVAPHRKIALSNSKLRPTSSLLLIWPSLRLSTRPGRTGIDAATLDPPFVHVVPCVRSTARECVFFRRRMETPRHPHPVVYDSSQEEADAALPHYASMTGQAPAGSSSCIRTVTTYGVLQANSAYYYPYVCR